MKNRNKLIFVVVRVLLPIFAACALVGTVTGRCPPMLPAYIAFNSGIYKATVISMYLVDHWLTLLAIAMTVHYLYVGIKDTHEAPAISSDEKVSFAHRVRRWLKITGDISMRIAVPVAFYSVFYISALPEVHRNITVL